MILNHFEGLKLTPTSLQISHLEQLNSKISAPLSTRFPCLKLLALLRGMASMPFIVSLDSAFAGVVKLADMANYTYTVFIYSICILVQYESNTC